MNSSDFVRFVKKQKKLPKHIRLYLISKNHYFINDGILKDGFDSKLKIENNRESVLSAFSKMAFIFDEIIRLRIVGYSHNQNSVELMYLLHLIPVNRKIRTFLDWKIFSPEFARDMSRLFLVRSGTVHCVSLNEVEYNPDKKLSLSQTKGINLFKKDMTKAWKNLLDIYVLEQEKISFEILSKEIKL
ncbi:MAG: hypothetical protein GTN97_03685 [Nitrosopumilaceae archaeon]|nr:hypothetical protein [Nitrosopumilaceae archaeon]NIP09387.1 hypothetical protein [Nitrosopumilaceae archaeon]NIS95010.1 hypothetical protein [Nitrosopumilaceae archaeon]